MLTRIKAIWADCKLYIIAVAFATAYLIGIKRGKNEQKAHQNDTLLADLARANHARAGLNKPGTIKRLHDKYRRR